MPISLKSAYSGGGTQPVGSQLAFADNLPATIVDEDEVWLRTGFIEDDTANFDEVYWDFTKATIWRSSISVSDRRCYSASANGTTIVAAFGATTTPAAGGVQVSTDEGVTWGSLIVPSGYDTDEYTYSIRYIPELSLWIAGSSKGKIHTSADAITWTSRTSGTTQRINAFSYANAILVVVGNNGVILTSPDGINYTSRTSGTGATELNSAAFYSGIWFVGGATQASKCTRSIDNGVTWTAVTVPPTFANPVNVVASPTFGFVFCSGSGGIWSSLTGLAGSWTLQNTLSADKVSFDGNFFIFSASTSVYKTFDFIDMRAYGFGAGTSNVSININQGQYLITRNTGTTGGELIKANKLPYAGNPTATVTAAVGTPAVGTAFYVRIS